jgi:hypothetical protein
MNLKNIFNIYSTHHIMFSGKEELEQSGDKMAGRGDSIRGNKKIQSKKCWTFYEFRRLFFQRAQDIMDLGPKTG